MPGNQWQVPSLRQGPCALHSTLDPHTTLQTFPSFHCVKGTLMTGAPSSSSMACGFTTSSWTPALSGLGHITCSSSPQFLVSHFCNFCLVPLSICLWVEHSRTVSDIFGTFHEGPGLMPYNLRSPFRCSYLLLGVHQASSLTYPVAAYAGLCIIFILLLRIFQSFHILQSERVQSNSLCNLCKPCRLQSSGRTGTKTSCDNRSATAPPSRLVLVPFLLHFCFLLLTHECKRDRGTKISLACSWMNTRHDSSTPTKSINSIKYKSYLHTMISFKAMSSSLFISGFPLRVQRIQYLGKAHAAIGWERVQSDSISAPRWTLIPIVLNC